MLLLGHSGFSLLITHPVRRQIVKLWLILGALGPDLIDKTLFFVAKKNVSFDFLGIITGTRTIGHSSFTFIPIVALAAYTGRLRWISLALGWILHLVIDIVGDSYEFFDKSPTVKALLYPILSGGFHINVPGLKMGDHIFARFGSAYVFYGEVLGGLILLGYAIEAWLNHRKKSGN